MDEVIRVPLSVAGIDAAIERIERYRQRLLDRCSRLASLVGERIAWSAQQGFSSAIADDIFRGGGQVPARVTVSVEENGALVVVIASGEDAVFVEFGAGVYHNGAAGASPHPKGAENGFLIGQYGEGHGKRNVWALPGSTNKNPILTHGTPAAMPMYHGVQEAASQIAELAREVFSS